MHVIIPMTNSEKIENRPSKIIAPIQNYFEHIKKNHIEEPALQYIDCEISRIHWKGSQGAVSIEQHLNPPEHSQLGLRR